jgi:hypothetical protein
MKNSEAGSQIHNISLRTTCIPYEVKNSPTPIGDTKTGLKEKKYLV